ncbi:WD40 repeat-like protein [Neoconidiobolus thromboides FSU 785]|nr:WD40 repeat-like protein [Neoconidiobolus thromboides FSU 785]
MSDSNSSEIIEESDNNSLTLSDKSSLIDIEKELKSSELQLTIDEDRYEYDHGQCDKNKIRFRGQVFDIDFHPTENILISGLLSGEIFCHGYTMDSFGSLDPVLKYKDNYTHKESVRGVKFSIDGNEFYSVSSDKTYSITDTQTGKIVNKIEGAFDTSINALLPIQQNLIACGDDDGVVKLFDTRTNTCSIHYKEHEDYITSLIMGRERQLISIGGDGYLSVMDVRKIRLYARSDQIEDELLSMSLIKEGKRLVVGTQSGVLDLFNYGDWGDFKDRFIGHPESVETMVKFDEDTIITGSSDGIIRLVSVHPNDLLGVVGAHDFPIERLAITKDKGILASCSHDHSIKLWNIKDIFNESDEEGKDEEGDEEEGSDDNDNDNDNEDNDKSDNEEVEDKEDKNRSKRKDKDSSSEEDSSDEEKPKTKNGKKVKAKLNFNNTDNNDFFDEL